MKRIVITELDFRKRTEALAKEQGMRIDDAYDPTSPKYLWPIAIGAVLTEVPKEFHLVHAYGLQLFVFEAEETP
jgi:hypothetical protein